MDFDGTVTAYREALGALLCGDHGPVWSLFSRRDDVTLANPMGPPCRGPAEVEKTIRAAAANFGSGTLTRVDEISRYATSDLGYVLQIEHLKGPWLTAMTSSRSR